MFGTSIHVDYSAEVGFVFGKYINPQIAQIVSSMPRPNMYRKSNSLREMGSSDPYTGTTERTHTRGNI
jgi:hypothetical protein